MRRSGTGGRTGRSGDRGEAPAGGAAAGRISRRDALKQLGAAGAGLLLEGVLPGRAAGVLRGPATAPIVVGGRPVEIEVWAVSGVTARITARPLEAGRPVPVPVTGALAREEPGTRAGLVREGAALGRVRAGELVVRFTNDPPTLHVETRSGTPVQRLTLDAERPGMSFLLGDGPVLGLGEGGAQFDRRGAVDEMRNGQGARSAGPKPYSLATHGTRAPVQWLIGTGGGWALFIHQPYGSFDLTGAEGRFTPRAEATLPLDVFVVASHDPTTILGEYARITGPPELPARWTLGYMQSHRTLAGPDEVLGVARTLREKRLPCDALIYLGTDFCPSGWNTHNGEFTWHAGNFPDPAGTIAQLHAEHFRVVMHVVVEGHTLTGGVRDPCTAAPLPSGRTPDGHWPPDRQASCYWPAHKPLMDVGVDGWWPDQGDGLDGPSRLNRHRMYWEGTQLYRPNERPFALHRNASPGIQRYGGFIWSGDTRSRWATLATHVPVAINAGLSGFPLWGSDIGGFIPTDEYTGELHVRWFQFGAFCPSFRAHGRNWHLRLPWGWDGGDGGPFETGDWRADPAELQNPRVEPILRKYLELRYRLLPYLYTAVRETHDTGLPVMRALWLHYPDDPAAIARGDEYLWGPDMLVAPVVEKGATSRRVYLPRGAWFDFWSEERIEGGREVERAVDLETMPLYVRAGAVLPLGPVKQHVDEPSEEPLSLTVYPGPSGTSQLYDDDGISFGYRRGEYTRLALRWDDARRRLTISVAPGARTPPPALRRFEVRIAGSKEARPVTFDGKRTVVEL
ncbi:MAG TPA: TIM-barrel domain-containing protein [Longimicrobiales bacterium]|nr:TIM-barrel domain-containing protein [Longimicrobiales bacterium]